MNKKFYDEYAKTFKRGEVFKRGVPLGNPLRVSDMLPFIVSPALDVGCTRGHDVKYFNQVKGKDIEGCDISSRAIELARQDYSPINFFVHDFENKKVTKKYSTVLALDVIDHVFDCGKFLENAWDCLKAGGYLILAIPNALSLKRRLEYFRGNSKYFYYGHFSHIRFFAVDSLTCLVKEKGFEIIKVFGYSSIPLPKSLCGALTIIAKKEE